MYEEWVSGFVFGIITGGWVMYKIWVLIDRRDSQFKEESDCISAQ